MLFHIWPIGSTVKSSQIFDISVKATHVTLLCHIANPMTLLNVLLTGYILAPNCFSYTARIQTVSIFFSHYISFNRDYRRKHLFQFFYTYWREGFKWYTKILFFLFFFFKAKFLLKVAKRVKCRGKFFCLGISVGLRPFITAYPLSHLNTDTVSS